MKNKIIGFLVITAINVYAIDVNGAIEIALKNNFSLKQQQYITEESKLAFDSTKSLYRPKIDLSYNYSDRNKIIVGQIDNDSSLSTNISYNLFNGFADKFNIDASKFLYNSSKFTLNAFKQDLVLDVKNKYITYLSKQKNTQTLKEALKLYEKQYFDSQNYLKQGLIAQNELLQVEVEMLQAKQNYQKAKSSQKIAKKQLKNVLGGEMNENEPIEELEKNDVFELNFDEKLLNNRSEIKATEELVKNYASKSKVSKGSYYPKVDAKFSYNKYGDDLMPSGRAGYPNSQNIGTVALNWNLYNGEKDKLEILIYNKKIKQAKMKLEDLKLQIKLQYEEAIEELIVSKLNYKTATKAKEQAKMNYDIVKNKVLEGISTNADLIDANYLLTKSKQNYFSAYYGRYLAKSTLQRIFENDK